MKKEIFKEAKNKIQRYVAAGRLREAFALARSLSEGNMAWEISDALNDAEQAYRQLLSYAVSGADDPSRDDMVSDLGERLLSITDRLERDNTARDEPTLYYNNLRYLRTNPAENLPALLEEYSRMVREASPVDLLRAGRHSDHFRTSTSERELRERRIFTHLWVTFPLRRADQEAVAEALASEILPEYARVLFAWGLILGALEFYDPARLILLADIYSRGEERSSAVALVGLLTVLHRWRNRRPGRKLQVRLDAMRESAGWKRDIGMAYMELVRTRDTDRITAKIRDEIVPQMMKLRPEIERKISPSPQELQLEDMEENPQWQELLESSGIADRLKEMSEIQEEGGDVMMGTFSHLKQFPFFNEISNWFLPFHSSRSEFSGSEGDGALGRVADMFETLQFLCDSDRYSLLMSLVNVPAGQRDMVMRQLNAQARQLEQIKSAGLDLPQEDRRLAIRRQVQNLYRFYRLFRRKGEFYNPFQSGLNLASVPALSEDLMDAQMLRLVAEFYFSHGYWQEALEVFAQVDALDGPDAALYQKTGHALMKLGRTADALAEFEKADLLDNRSVWTITRLARCHSLLGNHASTLSACQRLEELRPDQPSTALMMGRAYLAMGRHADAVKAFYKAMYLDEASGRALRPLAWSLLVDKQFDQSRKYYERIISDFDPRPEDYLNMGHLSLAEHRFDEAQNFYRLSILSRPHPAGSSGSRLPAEVFDSFVADMKADTPALELLGISSSLIPLIIDALRYALD